MTRYAIPNLDGTFRYVDAATTETISVGDVSFPPPWLAQATDEQRAAYGILTVVETEAPDAATNDVRGSSIQIINGVHTQVWDYSPISADEIAAKTAVEIKAQAQDALDKSDVTLLRCYEANIIPPPPDWVAYRKALRVISSSGVGPLPKRPLYPSGT